MYSSFWRNLGATGTSQRSTVASYCISRSGSQSNTPVLLYDLMEADRGIHLAVFSNADIEAIISLVGTNAQLSSVVWHLFPRVPLPVCGTIRCAGGTCHKGSRCLFKGNGVRPVPFPYRAFGACPFLRVIIVSAPCLLVKSPAIREHVKPLLRFFKPLQFLFCFVAVVIRSCCEARVVVCFSVYDDVT